MNDFVDRQEIDSEWKKHALLNYEELNLDNKKEASEYWEKVFEIKNATGQSAFPNLQKVIRLLLVLPFSNACVGRVFSEQYWLCSL